ncbi:hypothetical protein [Streptomyces sp. NPDC093591]|uniref:SCO4402 family protein n=1 Tax=Streptomyces sp. NPDC093591 TaxID=3366044 RepID=UPI003805F324
MPPDDVLLQTPWLRAQLIEWLVKLSDRGWQEGNWTSAGDSAMDDMLDFFDDTGVLDDPTGRVGFILRDEREVSVMKDLNAAVDRAITSTAESDREIIQSQPWDTVVATAREALRVMDVDFPH